MKKLKALIIMLIYFMPSYGQINIREHADTKQLYLRYDSLYNYLDIKEVKAYIGQSVFVIPKVENLRKFGYENFFTLPENNLSKRYSPNSIGSKYEDLVNRTFKVIDVVSQKGKYYGEDIFLKVADQSDTLYYLYPNSEHSFVFIVEGYTEKLKATYLNRDFYFSNATDEQWTDCETGDPVKLISGSQWTCKEIALDGTNFMFLNCILRNQNGETLCNMVNRMKHHFISKEYGDLLEKKYGGLYREAMAGTISMGMPKELVIIAKGEPTKIKRASYGEQWIYEYTGRCLYFEKDKITGWN